MRIHALMAASAALLAAFAMPAAAIGTLLDVRIIDRATGETLTPTWHAGRWWVAGKPGSRYAIAVANRAGERTLNVVSVDGVNAISGETAAWNQTGYVLGSGDTMQVTGWRKSMAEVASFEFTALPNSYAARTGRPGNVGVIGVALFREKPKFVVTPPMSNESRNENARPPPPIRARPDARGDIATNATADEAVGEKMAGASGGRLVPAAPAEADDAPAASAARAPESAQRKEQRQAQRLGTGHGEIEHSEITYTDFERMQSAPNEVVTIYYDSRENLIAMGVIAAPHIATNRYPTPFPADGKFVPDPPPRR